MTLQEIKDAIERGEKVYWQNTDYPVIKDNTGRYLIVHSNCSLTWADGVTMNGKESEFYNLTAKAIDRARDLYACDDVEIDDSPATSEAPEGTWVAAWVYVPREEIES